ncbi:MAG TPA: winged helix-turn-helix domain-containing protein [Burkholderiaceae bacterium]|nr:winged helix-turn-helix domain-containing protein [Burkholderiaceae bacterium]
MRVLLAEDDDLLGSGLRAGLRQQGFQVDWVRDGVAAENELMTGVYLAAVLDLGLPRLDGMDVLARVRARRLTTPVLVLTARDAVPDRIRGLDLGADDYIVKPVDLLELAARLRALVRRSHGQTSNMLAVGELTLDTVSYRVTWQGQLLDIGGREFDLLHVLMRNAGRVISRAQIEQHLYDWGREVSSNAIEVHIHHLRRKLPPGTIETVRGVGYVVHAGDRS